MPSEGRMTRGHDVDDYLTAMFAPTDPDLERALETSAKAQLPPIAVSALQGKFLQLLVQMRGARRVLEIGTLGGYSTIWLARALPSNGRLITLEIDPAHADIARKNLTAANLAGIVSVEVGPALQTLDRLIAERCEAFDLVFIDADKSNNPGYLRRALELSKRGTIIVIDNVVRGGAIVSAGSGDPNVVGTREVLEMLAREPRLDATAIQTVGHKGHDGFALALVL